MDHGRGNGKSPLRDWRVLLQVVGRSDPLRHFLSTQGPKQVLDERDVGLSDKTGRTVEWYNDSHAPLKPNK